MFSTCDFLMLQHAMRRRNELEQHRSEGGMCAMRGWSLHWLEGLGCLRVLSAWQLLSRSRERLHAVCNWHRFQCDSCTIVQQLRPWSLCTFARLARLHALRQGHSFVWTFERRLHSLRAWSIRKHDCAACVLSLCRRLLCVNVRQFVVYGLPSGFSQQCHFKHDLVRECVLLPF